MGEVFFSFFLFLLLLPLRESIQRAEQEVTIQCLLYVVWHAPGPLPPPTHIGVQMADPKANPSSGLRGAQEMV